MRLRRCVMLLVAGLWPLTGEAADAPKVVVSLKPLHALAAAVMDGVGAPQLLVQGAASEHSYALKPSEAAGLERADLVIWVGPAMEQYLVRPIKALPSHANIVTLIERSDLKRLPRRAGGPFEPDEDDHVAGVYDGHIWLDPRNAQAIGAIMAETLDVVDPAHKSVYDANLARLNGRLADLDTELSARLAPLKDKPIIVFHDAYQYLEARYGLNVVGSVTVDPTLSASAKRIASLRARITAQHVTCVFAEPQFEPKLLNALSEGGAVRKGVLDPLGASLPPGPPLYFTLMRNLAASLETCLNS